MNSFNIEFHPEALAEADAAVLWYKARSPAAAEAFLAEIDSTLSLLENTPLVWGEFRPGLRRAMLKRFPFAIVYRVNENRVQVVAVAHGRRRPGYWRLRKA